MEKVVNRPQPFTTVELHDDNQPPIQLRPLFYWCAYSVSLPSFRMRLHYFTDSQIRVGNASDEFILTWRFINTTLTVFFSCSLNIGNKVCEVYYLEKLCANP